MHQSRRKGNLKVELDQLPEQTVSRSVFLYFALGALRGKKDLRIADIHVEKFSREILPKVKRRRKSSIFRRPGQARGEVATASV